MFIAIFIGLITSLLFYSNWGRKVVYSDTNRTAPGIGKRSEQIAARFFLVDKSNFQEKWISVDELENYNKDNYNITFFPAKYSFVQTTGYVLGWEDTAELPDRYLVLDQKPDGIEKYRLILGGHEGLSRDADSFLYVETTGHILSDSPKTIRRVLADRPLSTVGINKLKRLIRKGDVITIVPRMDENGDIRVDEAGVTLIEFVLLRRSFGSAEIVFESIF